MRLNSTKRQWRNFWVPWVTTIVLACFSDAVAQVSYKVTDLGDMKDGNLGCAMGVNDRGWTEVMYGTEIDPLQVGPLVKGRAGLNIEGLKIDLGTLGGKNSWTQYNGINDRGEAVGLAETSEPDPNGEDICGFGTHLTCRPFLWTNGHMRALPTLGGNNGQASGINKSGQIAGYAENGIVDSTCPAGITNNQIDLPAPSGSLPTVGRGWALPFSHNTARMLANSFCRESHSANSGDKGIRSAGRAWSPLGLIPQTDRTHA